MIRNSPQHIAYYNIQSKQELIKLFKHLNIGIWVLSIFGILSFIFEQKQVAFLSFGFWAFCLLYCYYYIPKKRKEN